MDQFKALVADALNQAGEQDEKDRGRRLASYIQKRAEQTKEAKMDMNERQMRIQALMTPDQKVVQGAKRTVN
jgi:hypothetical protein